MASIRVSLSTSPDRLSSDKALDTDCFTCILKMFRAKTVILFLVAMTLILYASVYMHASITSGCREYKARLTRNPPGLMYNSTERRNQKKVIAMSLYGNDKRYTENAIRNSKLVRKNFPGWTLRFYMENQPPQYYPPVEQSVIEQLRTNGAEIVFLDLSLARIAPMLWRFLIADDYQVSVFIIRDADSLLTVRDASVVRDWLKKSKQAFHCIRDHPSHANWPVSGGLWGARRKYFNEILGLQSMECLMLSYGSAYLQDMEFVRDVIWPKVQDFAYCHDSVSCDTYPNSFPFPIRRRGGEHVGQVYDAEGLGRPIDLDIIFKTAPNDKCEPPRINETLTEQTTKLKV